jgi:hypothetical protein
MQGLCSRTSVDDEDNIADLKVAKILEQRLRHRTSGTSAYSHTYGNHDDSRNPISSRDAEVDGFGQGSRNFATRLRVTVVIPISYTTLWEATRERERQEAAARAGADAPGGGRRRSWRRDRGMCCSTSLLLGPPFI